MWRKMALDFLHVGVKTDGEHSVGFIKDKFPHMIKAQCPANQMVKNAARSSHNDGHAVLERIHLPAVGYASVHSAYVKAAPAEQGSRFTLHLHGKLTRRRENQRLHGTLCRVKTGEQGQQVRAGLAASGTGLHHDVAPFQHIGKCSRLNGHKRIPAGSRACVLQIRRQRGEIHRGQGVLRFIPGMAPGGILRRSACRERRNIFPHVGCRRLRARHVPDVVRRVCRHRVILDALSRFGVQSGERFGRTCGIFSR